MPISQILPDGNVQIYNSKTGEQKTVKPNELGQYNPALVADYQKKRSQIDLAKTGDLDLKELAKSDPQTAVLAMKEGAKGKSKQNDPNNIVNTLEDLYFKDKEGSGLASGRVGGFVAGATQSMGFNEPLNTFKRILESKRSLLAKAAGDSGNLALQEQILAGRGMPDEFSTPEEARALFRESRKAFGMKPSANKNISDSNGNNTGPSFGGFMQNTGQNAKDIGNALLGAPGAAITAMQEGFKDPQKAIELAQAAQPVNALGAMGQGLISSANDLLGRPMEGGDIIGRMGEHAYEKPVDTVLWVAPGVPKGLPKITSAVGKVTAKTKMGLPKIGGAQNVVNDAAIKLFGNNFTVPSKLAGRIKIEEVAQKMIENGHTGNLKELSAVADKVTGQNGIFPKLNREAISLIKEPIEFEAALSAGNKALKDIADLSRGEMAKHNQIIRGLIKPEGELGKTGGFSAFDAIQELEKRGYENINNSTSLTPRLKSEKIGNAYLSAADELKSQLESKSAINIDALKTPENIAQIQAISPKLAEEFINAKSIKDLRKVQAPYVKLRQAIDLSQNATKTPFQQLANEITRRTTGAGGGALIGSAFGPIGTGIGAIGGAIAAPMLEAGLHAVLPKITTGLSKKIYKSQGKEKLPPITPQSK